MKPKFDFSKLKKKGSKSSDSKKSGREAKMMSTGPSSKVMKKFGM